MNATESAPPSHVTEKPFTRRLRQQRNTPAHPRTAADPTPLKPGAGSALSDRTKTIVARVNAGWGNSVYIRGEGGCLNWEMGVPMICSGDDRWVWCCREDAAPRQFKFLRNDRDWALGENQIISGADITVCSPAFP